MDEDSDVEMKYDSDVEMDDMTPTVVHREWEDVDNMDVFMEALDANQLKFYHCNFTGYDFARWNDFCNELMNNQTIDRIIFTRFAIPPEGLDVFFEAMAMNQRCKILSLSEELLTPRCIHMLRQNKHLQTLEITRVYAWDGSSVPILAAGMAENTSVERLEFYGNHVNDDMDVLMNALCLNKKLHTLFVMPSAPWDNLDTLCHLLLQSDRIHHVRLNNELPPEEAMKVVRVLRQRAEEARVKTPLHNVMAVYKTFIPDLARQIAGFVVNRHPLKVESRAVEDILNPQEVKNNKRPWNVGLAKRARRRLDLNLRY